MNIPAEGVDSAWRVSRVTSRPGSKRAYIWEVACPSPPPEPDWENDFGRGAYCGCRRFRTEGKARRYVEIMESRGDK